MPRNTKTVTVGFDGRDRGKQYLLTEMPASQGERWANRVLFAISKVNPDLPGDVSAMGMAGIALFGIKAMTAIPWADAEPLFEEMFACIQAVTSAKIIRPLIEDDIEEVATRMWLRGELVELHTGFSLSAVLSTLGAALKKSLISSASPTSRKRSAA